MFKNTALGTKIILGFLLVTALTAISGVVGYRGVTVVGEALHIVGDEERKGDGLIHRPEPTG